MVVDRIIFTRENFIDSNSSFLYTMQTLKHFVHLEKNNEFSTECRGYLMNVPIWKIIS